MEEDDLWEQAFGGGKVKYYGDEDPFTARFVGRQDDGDSSGDEPGDIREDLVLDYESEVAVRGAAGGTQKDVSKMTTEEKARMILTSAVSEYDFANPRDVVASIISWCDRKPRVDLFRFHAPTLVCAWLWYQKHKSELKGLPRWCQDHKIDYLAAAIYVAAIHRRS